MKTLEKYYTINQFSKILGVTPQTLRNWDRSGKLPPHHTSGNGYRYYSSEQLNQIRGIKPKKRMVIGYCRVSSHKQKDDLERQIENVRNYLIAQGKPFEIITDIGSGINYNKKGLQNLIEKLVNNEVEKIVAGLYGCEIEIIDNTQKTEQQELLEDLVQIITVFSCKLQGKRANKAKKIIKELIAEDGDGGDNQHKDNASSQ